MCKVIYYMPILKQKPFVTTIYSFKKNHNMEKGPQLWQYLLISNLEFPR